MKTDNKKNEPLKTTHQKLQEIGKILAFGIIRLSARKRAKETESKHHIPLDHKNFPSTHSNSPYAIGGISNINY